MGAHSGKIIPKHLILLCWAVYSGQSGIIQYQKVDIFLAYNDGSYTSTSAFCGCSNLYRSCFVNVSLKYLCSPLAVSEETPVLLVNKTIHT